MSFYIKNTVEEKIKRIGKGKCFNNIIIGHTTTTDVRKWINHMLYPNDGKQLAITTINRRLNSLRSFYSWAQKNKKLQHNQGDRNGVRGDGVGASESHCLWVLENL
jgi:site-specific recombinase XerD